MMWAALATSYGCTTWKNTCLLTQCKTQEIFDIFSHQLHYDNRNWKRTEIHVGFNLEKYKNKGIWHTEMCLTYICMYTNTKFIWGFMKKKKLAEWSLQLLLKLFCCKHRKLDVILVTCGNWIHLQILLHMQTVTCSLRQWHSVTMWGSRSPNMDTFLDCSSI